MSEKMSNLFAANENEATTVGARSLAGTAQLTSIANTIAQDLIKKISDETETYGEQFENSKVDHNAMDALINSMTDLSTVETEFLKELDEETLNSMLKSQQSKRSRSKNKTMTLDNYRNLMAGAVSELLIRQVMGKAKSSMGYRRASGSVEYTAEELEMYKNDQDALKREIRNVQSKKSIMKSKVDFTEEDERWGQLLAAEETLKGMRVGGGVKTVIVDKTGEQLKAELGDKDIDSLKATDAKALLKKLLEAAGGKVEAEEPTAE